MTRWMNLSGLALLALAGCAVPPGPVMQTRIQVERVTLPAGLLTCASEPALNAWTMQSDVADYIVRLHEAWADCHADVGAIAQIEAVHPSPPQ